MRKGNRLRLSRHFAKEFGIVVLGVFTALAAEQSVAWLQTQAALRQARGALRAEIAEDGEAAAFISAEDNCLLAYDKRTIAWAQGGSKPQTNPIPRYPTLQSTVWETTRTGAITQMPLGERLQWARLYNLLGAFNHHEAEQRTYALELAAVSFLDTLNQAQAAKVVEGLNIMQRIDLYQIRDSAELIKVMSSVGVAMPSFSEATRRDLEAICLDAGAVSPNT